jgi:hypothetical protein
VRDLATAAHCDIAAVHDHCGDTVPLYHVAFSRLAKEHREGRARCLRAELDTAGPGESLETGRPARHEPVGRRLPGIRVTLGKKGSSVF